MTETDIRTGLSPGEGTATVTFDAAIGVIRVCAIGFLTPEQMDASFVQVRAHVASLRNRSRPVRVLVDTRLAPIQSAESAERLRIETGESYYPGDRVAVIVASMLGKMQLRRVLDSRNHRLFLAEDAALLWLDEPA